MNKYVVLCATVFLSSFHGLTYAMDCPDAAVIVPNLPNGAREKLSDYEMNIDRNHRAAVIAIDRDGGYALGMVYDCASQAEAELKALYLCEKSKKKYGIQGDPLLYAVDDQVVYHTHESLKWHSINMAMEGDQKSRQNKVDM